MRLRAGSRRRSAPEVDPRSAPEVDPRWYRTFFDRDWLALAVDHDEQLTRAEVDFLVEKLELERGARVLDLACGHGRHAVELAALGFHVTGLDISEPALAMARERAASRQVELDVLRLDMGDLDADSRFSAVYNLSSAFGYYPSEEEDLAVLQAVARALVPGGRFLIDTMNGLWLVRNFEPRARRRLADGTHVIEERSFDPITSRSSATWTLRRRDGSRSEMRHSMRIYSAPELQGMLVRAGLEPDGIWGGVDGAAYGVEARRLIVRAVKPQAQPA